MKNGVAVVTMLGLMLASLGWAEGAVAKPCEQGGSCGYGNVTAAHARALAAAQWTVPLGPCHNNERAGHRNHYGGVMTQNESDWSCLLKDPEEGSFRCSSLRRQGSRG